MIQKVTNAPQRANFLAAAGAEIATRAQMGVRLALFADLPGSGWQFYTSDAAPFAIALRGASATVAGEYDPEELGSFCSFLGIDCITTPCETPPQGYVLRQTLSVYTLAAGKRLPLPPLTGAFAGQAEETQAEDVAGDRIVTQHATDKQKFFTLEKAPSLSAIVPLLFAGEDAEIQDRYYADACTARNAGMAEFWLLRHEGVPIFTVAASAILGRDVYLSAGETIEAHRGQGIGGRYITQMANEYAAKGYDVCFVCEAVRCRFYNRLGFAQSGVLYQYGKVKSEG